ncbi:uncharacterized protein LOC117315340 [Pecten maximus]|uniref:uncharacterized protein LOC117315340 n=1 Tax=Pecten maximus TaxID=6579 RepID=UPI001458038B|nr:uncharacterized protein LOC117315340 [Pecten maximus]
MEEAYDDVKTKHHKIRSAAKIHNIPESTLRYRLKHPEGTDVKKKGGPTIFSRKQEELLADHCIGMAHLGYGFTRWQIIEMAKNMCEVVGKENIEPTKHWFYGFLVRFPELSMVKPKKREVVRDKAVTSDILCTYFAELKLILDKYQIMNKAEQIWNVDESGISLDHTPPKVLARAGTNPYAVTQGKSANTTLIAAGSAIGETTPPYIIFKGERLSKEMRSSGIQGTEYRVSPTGWSNSVLFFDFFKNHFLKHVTIRPCILLYDGHSTHINIDVIEAAREEDVHLFVLPPHNSHCSQPLDFAGFSPLKCSLNAQIHKFLHSNPNSVITPKDLPSLIGTAYKSALTEKSSEYSTRLSEKGETKKKRKAFVPPYGCAITEDESYQKKKEMQKRSGNEKVNISETDNVKHTSTAKRKSFKPPLKEQICKENQGEDVSDPKKPKTTTGKLIGKGKGPHKNSRKGKKTSGKKRAKGK